MKIKTLDKLAELKNKEKKPEIPEVQYPYPKDIDTLRRTKIRLKETQTKLKKQQEEIRKFGEDVLLERALNDKKFTKTIIVKGEKHSVRITKPDRFMIKDKDPEKAIKKIIGKRFDQFFDKERLISVKDEVFENKEILKKFLSKFDNEELEEYFDIGFIVKAKEGFDKKQYQYLTPEEREKMNGVVNQVAASVIIYK